MIHTGSASRYYCVKTSCLNPSTFGNDIPPTQILHLVNKYSDTKINNIGEGQASGLGELVGCLIEKRLLFCWEYVVLNYG